MGPQFSCVTISLRSYKKRKCFKTMDNSNNYEIVRTTESDDEHYSWKHLFRQLLVCSALWVNYFLYGLCLGGPTVYIPQLRREANSTEVVSEEMASWLVSIYSYGCIPWVILLPISAAFFGQKLTHILITVNSCAASTFFYLSSNVTEIFISQVMESINGAAIATISVSIIAEFTSPRYRGIFLTFKSATLAWGIWIANAIGTFYHWKTIAMLKLVLSFYPLIIVFFWPESPYWLASKGRLDKCSNSHRWLKGNSTYSENELEKIIESQKGERKCVNIKNIFTKEYIKLVTLSVGILSFYTFTGKLSCAFYSLDILKKMTSSESTAYTGMLILDGLSVLGMYIGTILSKFFKRRIIFFSAAFAGILSLWILGAYTYLINASILIENAYISLILLSLYSIGISCGPFIFCSSLYAEFLPLQYRSLAMCIVAIFYKILMGTVNKLAPLVMRRLGLHVVFLFFSGTSTISLYLLYKYMPETKDRTLVEITEEMNGVVDHTKQNTRQRNDILLTNKYN